MVNISCFFIPTSPVPDIFLPWDPTKDVLLLCDHTPDTLSCNPAPDMLSLIVWAPLQIYCHHVNPSWNIMSFCDPHFTCSTFSVPGCNPSVPNLDELVKELNTSNCLSNFILAIRKAFKDLCLQWRSKSFVWIFWKLNKRWLLDIKGKIWRTFFFTSVTYSLSLVTLCKY